MSLFHPFNQSELRPEIRLETFEDLTTIRKVVGEDRGFEDRLTEELRSEIRTNAIGGQEQLKEPISYVGDEAKIIARALGKATKRQDDLAESAADVLSRLPVRMRAAAFIATVFSREEIRPADTEPRVSYPMFDPNHPEPRPPIVWESKYDNSRKGKRSS